MFFQWLCFKTSFLLKQSILSSVFYTGNQKSTKNSSIFQPSQCKTQNDIEFQKFNDSMALINDGYYSIYLPSNKILQAKNR